MDGPFQLSVQAQSSLIHESVVTFHQPGSDLSHSFHRAVCDRGYCYGRVDTAKRMDKIRQDHGILFVWNCNLHANRFSDYLLTILSASSFGTPALNKPEEVLHLDDSSFESCVLTNCPKLSRRWRTTNSSTSW